MIFIVEHMEDELFDWCMLEYKHISRVVGKDSCWFTNIKSAADRKKLEPLGIVHEKGVAELAEKGAELAGTSNIDISRVCLLDLSAQGTLAPSDAKRFDFMVFGGILGDNPPKGRTKALRLALEKIAQQKQEKGATLGIRDLGPLQMSTDTAVLVSKTILDGTPLDKIPFLDTIQIEMGEGEEVELPYRYVAGKDGRPILPEGLIEKLMKDEEF
jgi:ribosome biogenesis SPOUT family RNA methylase Rps3